MRSRVEVFDHWNFPVALKIEGSCSISVAASIRFGEVDGARCVLGRKL